jgi:hypothetical protein
MKNSRAGEKEIVYIRKAHFSHPLPAKVHARGTKKRFKALNQIHFDALLL